MNRAEKLKNIADKRVREITKHAKAVFLKKGYSSSTMEEIAKLAGVSKGTVYLYFKNKDDLYVSMIMAHFEENVKLLRVFRDEFSTGRYGSIQEVFRKFYENYVRLYRNDPDGLRITQIYLLEDLYLQVHDKTNEKLVSLAKEARSISEDILFKCMKLGLLPKENPKQLMDVLTGSFLGIVQLEDHKFRHSGKDHLADTLNLCISLFAEGLSKGMEGGKLRLFKKTTNHKNARRR